MAITIDGGLSTELERLGAEFDGPLWTGRTLLENPDLIAQAHRNFVDAGAKVVITSSYQISRAGFAEIGLASEQADEALRNSVAVARAAVKGTDARVAASVGPYGAILHDGSEYRGNYGVSKSELVQFHSCRIAVLESAEPDILLAETIPDLTEAQALAEAFSGTKLPVWVSFTVESADKLWSGDSVADAILAVSQIPTLESVGFNCVNPDLITDLVKLAKSLVDTPISVYPNKGGEWDSETGVWSYQHGKNLTEYWPSWRHLGIRHVGGCCGLNANDIRELSQTVSKNLQA